MIDPSDRKLSIKRQCELIGKSRSYYYYESRHRNAKDIEEMIKRVAKYRLDPQFHEPHRELGNASQGTDVSERGAVVGVDLLR